MTPSQTEPKALWGKLTGASLAVNLGAPVLFSLVLLALLVAALWLFVCGFYNIAMARWFGRPGACELLLRDKQPRSSRIYFAIASILMMSIALLLGSCFLLRSAHA